MKSRQNRDIYKQEPPLYKKARYMIVAGVFLLLALHGCANGSTATAPSFSVPNASPSTSGFELFSPTPALSSSASAVPSSGAPTGIDPDKFFTAVESYINDLNAENTGIGDLTVKMSVTYIIGFVDITFTDMTSWSNFTDTEKREFIIALGKTLDAIAADNIYPGTLSAVGTDTTLNSPDGVELAERTSLGIVFLR